MSTPRFPLLILASDPYLLVFLAIALLLAWLNNMMKETSNLNKFLSVETILTYNSGFSGSLLLGS